MAVTDHAEFLGEQTLCGDPDSPASAADFCQAFADGQGDWKKAIEAAAKDMNEQVAAVVASL